MLKAKKQGTITPEQKQEAEDQIRSMAKIVDYNTREYPVEVLVMKYLKDKEDENNEIFIPDYQREFVWDEKRQSKFIESVLIGLPIPFFFVADVVKKEGRLEVVDGSQRLRTLAAFQEGELRLQGLEKLDTLNGFTYFDLPLARQRRFRGSSLRTIVLSEKADEEVRRDIFERINTGSDGLKAMEIRRGIKQGPFLDFVNVCANDERLLRLAPLGEGSRRRKENEEFTLRYFAYADRYTEFKRRVVVFVDSYFKDKQAEFTPGSKRYNPDEAGRLKREFSAMLDFVDTHFKYGFAKPNHSRTPRIRFEAISVGVTLALREKPNLKVSNIDWIDSDEFKKYTTSDASNSRPKVVRRIEFVRDSLLSASID